MRNRQKHTERQRQTNFFGYYSESHRDRCTGAFVLSLLALKMGSDTHLTLWRSIGTVETTRDSPQLEEGHSMGS